MMQEQNIDNDNPFGQTKTEPKSKNSFGIVGYNLAVLAAYTLISRISGDGGFVIDAFFLVAHVFTCITVAVAKRSWMWVLAALLVLAIGFSTCVYGGIV